VNDLPEPVAALCAVLGAEPGVLAVALGGSRAVGTAEESSDWDIGVYYRGRPWFTRVPPDAPALLAWVSGLRSDLAGAA